MILMDGLYLLLESRYYSELEVHTNQDQKQAEIDRLEAENEAQNVRFASLEHRLLAMEASMK